MSTENNFELPSKVDSYLGALCRLYHSQKNDLLRKIIVNSKVTVKEGWDYDNWNGGTYGHAVVLDVPEDLYFSLMDNKDEAANSICSDLNKLDSVDNEWFSNVYLNLAPNENDDWRESSGVLHSRNASVSDSALERIWEDTSLFRIFLSHKATIKADTFRLKKSLKKCGIEAFVAHVDIEPTEEWAREIECALSSMDSLVALLTKDFQDSAWTDQEVGFALGRGVPVVTVALDLTPYGPMGKWQALKCKTLEDTDRMAAEIFGVLLKKVSNDQRLFRGALDRYANSVSWDDSAWNVQNLLAKFEILEMKQVDQIIGAYKGTCQNRDSFKANKLLQPLLVKWTGDKWPMKNGKLLLPKPKIQIPDELPF